MCDVAGGAPSGWDIAFDMRLTDGGIHVGALALGDVVAVVEALSALGHVARALDIAVHVGAGVGDGGGAGFQDRRSVGSKTGLLEHARSPMSR